MDIDHILKDKKRIEKLNKDLQNVLNNYPSLMVSYEKHDATYVYGIYKLLDGNGFVLYPPPKWVRPSPNDGPQKVWHF